MTLKVLILTRIHSNLLLSWVVFQGETPFPLLVNGIEETTSANVNWFTILNKRYESTHTVSPARQQSQKTRHWSNPVGERIGMIHLSWRMTIWGPFRGAHHPHEGPSGPNPGIPELVKQSGDVRDSSSTFLKLDKTWNQCHRDNKGSIGVLWIVSIETLQVHSCHSTKESSE